MSDAKQPEQMRPIPDGGLKDAMPSWLKRPPAWRDLPNAEQRHERSLPEPDTSEIDPRSLVDVSDLPQWLQAIAARGDIPVPTPDASVDHAVEVVQAARRPVAPGPDTVGPALGVDPRVIPELPELSSDGEPDPAATAAPDEQPTPDPVATPVPTRTGYPVWIWPIAALVIIALFVTLYLFM